MTTVSHRDLLVAWLRARAPKPGGSYHAWVSLQPGPRALSVGRAWCPPGFIRQNGVCTGKVGPVGHTLLCFSGPRAGRVATTPVFRNPGFTGKWAGQGRQMAASSLHDFSEPRLCQWARGFQSGWSVFQTI